MKTKLILIALALAAVTAGTAQASITVNWTVTPSPNPTQIPTTAGTVDLSSYTGQIVLDVNAAHPTTADFQSFVFDSHKVNPSGVPATSYTENLLVWIGASDTKPYTAQFEIQVSADKDKIHFIGSSTPLVFKLDGYEISVTPADVTYTLYTDSKVSGFTGADWKATAVPEPSTVFAGALLILPFGVSAFRSLRRNRE